MSQLISIWRHPRPGIARLSEELAELDGGSSELARFPVHKFYLVADLDVACRDNRFIVITNLLS